MFSKSNATPYNFTPLYLTGILEKNPLDILKNPPSKKTATAASSSTGVAQKIRAGGKSAGRRHAALYAMALAQEEEGGDFSVQYIYFFNNNRWTCMGGF